MELSAVLAPAAEGGYIALNPETGTNHPRRNGRGRLGQPRGYRTLP